MKNTNIKMATIEMIPSGETVAIYGAGEFGQIVLRHIKNSRNDINVAAFVDKSMHGNIDGIAILKPEDMVYEEVLVLICSSHYEQIEKTLTSLGCHSYIVMDNMVYFPSAHYEQSDIDIYNYVKKYTMTGERRVMSLLDSVSYIEKHEIPGDIVECGVWAGGSMMAVAKKLIHLNNQSRSLYLYDTFEGMTKPSEHDKSTHGPAIETFNAMQQDSHNAWCYAGIDEVRENMRSTGYADEKIEFIKGDVLKTIPGTIPERISLLRLDTDFYESTLHELEHLFPRLSKHGIIILDDYNYWQGCRKAADEYIERNNIQIFLHGIDSCGAVGVKLTD